MRLFKKKFKVEYYRAINKKIAYPDVQVLCPRCGKPLIYEEVGNGASVRCSSKKCIKGDSWATYGFQKP